MDVPSIAIFKCRRVDLRFRLDIHPSSTGSGEDGDNLTAEDEAGGGASLQALEAEAWETNGNMDHDL